MMLRYSLGHAIDDARPLQLWQELGECEVEMEGVVPPHPRDFPHLDPYAESLEAFLLDTPLTAINLGQVTREAIVVNIKGDFCDPCMGDLFLMWHGTRRPGVIEPYLGTLS